MAEIYVPIWMRGTPLEQIYLDAWVDTGDVELAREQVRASDFYNQLFPGNRRPDGSIRYGEDTYLSIVESFQDTLLSVNVNPDLFANKFGDLIAGGVSPAEFTSRVEGVYTRVIDAVPEVRQTMEAYYGTGLSDAAILASFLDPDVSSAILEKRIAVSEVGAEASRRNFTVAQDFANMLYEAGTDTASEAAQFFSLAQNTLPVLQTLAARHANPDDEFTLEEFAAAQIFNDPTQRRTMRLLLAQERSTFSQAPETGIVRAGGGTLAGSLTGLIEA